MESIANKPILEIFKLSRNVRQKLVFDKHRQNVPTSYGIIHMVYICMSYINTDHA